MFAAFGSSIHTLTHFSILNSQFSIPFIELLPRKPPITSPQVFRFTVDGLEKHSFLRLNVSFHATHENLFFAKEGVNDIFCEKKFVMSLFRTIFAFGNGREVANLGFVFSECLRHAFALSSLPEAEKGRRLAQGNAAQPRHKHEFFDIFAYWFRPIVRYDRFGFK